MQIVKIISQYANDASDFIHACDYDQEGEVIGYNILQYACKNKYHLSKRARFSTLTCDEIQQSFKNLEKPNYGLAKAGLTRHILDFIYGVNLSRALSQSYKKSTNRYNPNMSIGRVQGPTLSFVVSREIEINSHIPVPYWIISAQFQKQGHPDLIKTTYEKKVQSIDVAENIVNYCKNKQGTVIRIEPVRKISKPPFPFNIGDLQREAFRLFKISPSQTLATAERLYLDALISYPRTSSQQIPASIDYRKIISKLGKLNKNYEKISDKLLSTKGLSPSNGPKTDPAHPAIYPTGQIPSRKMKWIEYKIYDLISLRFFAAFGQSAVFLNTDIVIAIDNYNFTFQASSIANLGWIEFYRPYVQFTERSLPGLIVNEKVANISTDMENKFTEPSPRFNQSSLLELMEREEIGTKATRSEIINILFKRNYISYLNVFNRNYKTGGAISGQIQATDFGIAVNEAMHSYVPEIASTSLTREIELDLELIEKNKLESAEAVKKATSRLVKSLEKFIENEASIGQKISHASQLVETEKSILGSCAVCGTGNMVVRRSKVTKSRFAGCSNFHSGFCRAIAPLPQRGGIIKTGKNCVLCKWPVINIRFGSFRTKFNKPWKICINPNCPGKMKHKEKLNEN